MSRKRIVVIAVFAVVVLGGAGGVGLWQYHERPQFCATCHIMEPYLESWQASDYGAYAHAQRGVTCLECHVPTVQQQVDELLVYMQGDFTVPLKELEVSDQFCYDCHLEDEHASVEQVVLRTADREVNPHESHLIGEMGCDTCHNMHRASEDYCAECHDPMATGPGWTTEATRTAEMDVWEPDMDCSVCHVMDPYVESLEDTSVLAYAHAQEGLECLDCHEEDALEETHEEAEADRPVKQLTVEMAFCFDCHVENDHTSYEEVAERTEGYMIGEEEINPHDPHVATDGVDPLECSSCHQMHEESALAEGCYSCHHTETFVSCSSCHAE
jgi:cytochrome c nitrite reductase small subunit